MMGEKIKEPKYIESVLHNPMLNYKTYYMSFLEKIEFFFLFFTLGGFTGYIFWGGLFKRDGEPTSATHICNVIVFCVVGLIAVKVFLPRMRQNLREKRDKKLQRQFMDMLEGLSTSLSSGNTMMDSFVNTRSDLSNQYSENEMIMLELKEIIDGIKYGATLEDMLLDFGKRSGNEDIENFANVVNNCFRLGGNFKDVIRRTRDVIADKFSIADEIETKLTSNRTQLNIMSLMPIALVAMLKNMNSTFSEGLSSFVGVMATLLAVAMFVGAYFWGQKIIDVR